MPGGYLWRNIAITLVNRAVNVIASLQQQLCPTRHAFRRGTPIDRYQRIGKFRRPILASFGQEVEEIPDRRIEVDSPVVGVVVWTGMKRRFGSIEVMDFAVSFATKHAHAGVLSSVVFKVEIRVETRLAAG